MGTRVKSSRTRQIINRINLPNAIEILTDGFLGGLWLLWKTSTDFKVDILRTHERYIHYQIKDDKKDIHRLTTFLYGYPLHHLQNKLWKEIYV